MTFRDLVRGRRGFAAASSERSEEDIGDGDGVVLASGRRLMPSKQAFFKASAMAFLHPFERRSEASGPLLQLHDLHSGWMFSIESLPP